MAFGELVGSVVTSLAFLTLEPEHDGGSRLVPGPAEADAGEGGGDPLGQQVPPPAPAPRETRQVRAEGPAESWGCSEGAPGTALIVSVAVMRVGVCTPQAVPRPALGTEQGLAVE